MSKFDRPKDLLTIRHHDLDKIATETRVRALGG
jgi:hypothetical protein